MGIETLTKVHLSMEVLEEAIYLRIRTLTIL
jgi:hypothetical protein